jgi:hypothetical protein
LHPLEFGQFAGGVPVAMLALAGTSTKLHTSSAKPKLLSSRLAVS